MEGKLTFCFPSIQKKIGEAMSKQRCFIAITTMSLLCSCATQHPSAISFYDSCAKQSTSFVDTATCGKLNRNTYCEANNNCSADGDALVQYADSLVKSIQNHELSDSEAQRKWIEFRTAQLNAAKQRAATLAAGAMAPSTCIRTGAITNCY
jgi:hypothetical protein